MFLGSNSLHNLSYLGNSLDSMTHRLYYGSEGIKSIKGYLSVSQFCLIYSRKHKAIEEELCSKGSHVFLLFS